MIDIDDDINLDDISDEIDDISLIFGVNWWYLMIDIDDDINFDDVSDEIDDIINGWYWWWH